MSFDLESCENSESSGCSIEDKLPTKNCLIRGKDGVYAVGRKISQGRYGAVYEVLRRADGKPFACKLEICEAHSHGLDQDYSVMNKAAKRGAENLVRMIDRGKIEEHFKFIIMPLLGENLMNLRFLFEDGRFSLSTGLRLALLAIQPIQTLHQIGYVHRDIKASNFCLANSHAINQNPDELKLVLVDYGICRSFKDKSGELKTPRTDIKFRGTNRYASLAAHYGEEQSTKDDMESWFYMMVELISGNLPWSFLHRDQNKEVAAMKEACRTTEGSLIMMKYCPRVEFHRIQAYLMGLKYQNTVDYTFITEMVQLAMRNNGVRASEKFDWQED
uniref:non-specific serine/threonine protein kinase n=1 Tax=Caenorhabditis japonica TaxID=281687 RepID=A0A8R1HNI8_CAEJA